MKVIHKISPVLILAGYFYILYEGYFLCQFGGVRYHGQKMAVGAAVMAVGFLFWLITRKKAKEQQAGKKQYLWIAELVAAGAATIICGAAVIRTAIPYNGALSWKIDEWRRIIDESSSNANSDTNKEENEPAISDEAETETETKTSENIRNSDTWEFNAEDGDMYYFINDITGYRLNVVDAACGSRFYNFEKTKDGGTTWTEVNYGNAKPGIIMDAFSMAGESNLVFIINELDKAASGKGNGNPADVLLTLLDNLGFTDNYMECMIPTGGVYPIATANVKEDISAPLMSRFAVIDIPDYTQEEKKIIFSKFALPKVLKRIGLLQGEIVLTGEGLDELIEQYKNTSGIRDLEQAAEHLAANALYQIEVDHVKQVVFDAEMVKKLFA